MSRRPVPTVFAAPLPHALGGLVPPPPAPRPDGSWAARGRARAGLAGLATLVLAVTASTASAGVIAAVAISRVPAAPPSVTAPAAPVRPAPGPAAPAPRRQVARPSPAPGLPTRPSLPGVTAPASPPSTVAPRVVVYGATWCGACRSLEAQLRARGVPFTEVDVDRDGAAFDRAIAASGRQRAVPLTQVVRDLGTTWVQGADGAGVERAYRGR